MSNKPNAKRKKIIAHYIDENLKEVFAEYTREDLPPEVVDLLSVLKAQDQEMDDK